MFDKSVCEIKVGGMMCEHCAASVKKALEGVAGVKSAEVDLKKGSVKVKYKGDLPEKEIEEAVKGAGYKFGGVLA